MLKCGWSQTSMTGFNTNPNQSTNGYENGQINNNIHSFHAQAVQLFYGVTCDISPVTPKSPKSSHRIHFLQINFIIISSRSSSNSSCTAINVQV